MTGTLMTLIITALPSLDMIGMAKFIHSGLTTCNPFSKQIHLRTSSSSYYTHLCASSSYYEGISRSVLCLLLVADLPRSEVDLLTVCKRHNGKTEHHRNTEQLGIWKKKIPKNRIRKTAADHSGADQILVCFPLLFSLFSFSFANHSPCIQPSSAAPDDTVLDSPTPTVISLPPYITQSISGNEPFSDDPSLMDFTTSGFIREFSHLPGITLPPLIHIYLNVSHRCFIHSNRFNFFPGIKCL